MSWRRRRSSRMYTTRSWCWNLRRWNDHNNPLSVPHPQDIHLSDTLPPTRPSAQLQVCKRLFFFSIIFLFPTTTISLIDCYTIIYSYDLYFSSFIYSLFWQFSSLLHTFILVVSSPQKIILLSLRSGLFHNCILHFFTLFFSKWQASVFRFNTATLHLTLFTLFSNLSQFTLLLISKNHHQQQRFIFLIMSFYSSTNSRQKFLAMFPNHYFYVISN